MLLLHLPRNSISLFMCGIFWLRTFVWFWFGLCSRNGQHSVGASCLFSLYPYHGQWPCDIRDPFLCKIQIESGPVSKLALVFRLRCGCSSVLFEFSPIWPPHLLCSHRFMCAYTTPYAACTIVSPCFNLRWNRPPSIVAIDLHQRDMGCQRKRKREGRVGTALCLYLNQGVPSHINHTLAVIRQRCADQNQDGTITSSIEYPRCFQ